MRADKEKSSNFEPGGQNWKRWHEVGGESSNTKNKLYDEPYGKDQRPSGSGEIEELQDFESSPFDTNDE